MSTQVDGDGPSGAGTSSGRRCCGPAAGGRAGDDRGGRLLCRDLLGLAVLVGPGTSAAGGGPGARVLGPTRRVEAVREVSGPGLRPRRRSIRLLMPSLKDEIPASARRRPDRWACSPRTRSHRGPTRTRPGHDGGLIEMMKDPEARVRAAVGTSVAVIAQAATRRRRRAELAAARKAMPRSWMSTRWSPPWSSPWMTPTPRRACRRSPGWAPWLRRPPAGHRRRCSRPWTTSRPPIGRRRRTPWPATGRARPGDPALAASPGGRRIPVRDACAGALRKILPRAVDPGRRARRDRGPADPRPHRPGGLVTLLGRLKPDPARRSRR